ncbi:hypothetical protein BJ741DRAFT_705501 [Chytriomyces cf. hyalinus JEL632]|nr:hypothetical protein BJ741DRAFT_705501 [Chytriomyces cf. hyalinus JEL632]
MKSSTFMCKITGIATVFGNPHKTELLAQHNTFSIIPVTISQLTTQEYLRLSGNPFSCELPSGIWNLRSLMTLDMSGCKMFVSLAGIGALRHLEVLDVSNNQLSGDFPSGEICSLHDRNGLHIIRNKISGYEGGLLDTNLKSLCADRDFRRKHVKRVRQCYAHHDTVAYSVYAQDSDSNDFESDSGSDTTYDKHHSDSDDSDDSEPQHQPPRRFVSHQTLQSHLCQQEAQTQQRQFPQKRAAH